MERRWFCVFLLTGVMRMALWAKGQSGNPTGRPKEAHELRDLARYHGPAAIACLARIMEDNDAPHASRVAAASIILDRGYGKPIQPTLVTAVPFSDLDDGALLQTIMRKAAELGAPSPPLIEHQADDEPADE
jgi:Family of unknown function (DUF5681)